MFCVANNGVHLASDWSFPKLLFRTMGYKLYNSHRTAVSPHEQTDVQQILEGMVVIGKAICCLESMCATASVSGKLSQRQ
jgi:lysozyme family protein